MKPDPLAVTEVPAAPLDGDSVIDAPCCPETVNVAVTVFEPTVTAIVWAPTDTLGIVIVTTKPPAEEVITLDGFVSIVSLSNSIVAATLGAKLVAVTVTTVPTGPLVGDRVTPVVAPITVNVAAATFPESSEATTRCSPGLTPAGTSNVASMVPVVLAYIVLGIVATDTAPNFTVTLVLAVKLDPLIVTSVPEPPDVGVIVMEPPAATVIVAVPMRPELSVTVITCDPPLAVKGMVTVAVNCPLADVVTDVGLVVNGDVSNFTLTLLSALKFEPAIVTVAPRLAVVGDSVTVPDATTVKVAVAFLPVASLAVTVWLPTDVVGIVMLVLKLPAAVVVTAVESVSVVVSNFIVMLEVGEKFVPETEVFEPAIPEVGESVMAADATVNVAVSVFTPSDADTV
jgi:hypothetical protein